MTLSVFSVGLLVIALLLQLTVGERHGFGRIARILFFAAVMFVVGYLVYLIAVQYTFWRNAGPPSSYLVPPYRSITYVVWYQFVRFGFYYTIAFAISAALWLGGHWLDKWGGKRFFYVGELPLAALSVFLLGNPAWQYAWLYYIAALLVSTFLITGYRLLVIGKNNRFSLFWLWLPLALVTVLFYIFA